jgi:hypothetical protein
MKTPREILLSRHASANRKLDAIREQVVAAECGREARQTRPQPAIRSFCAPWHARFWPSPWAWAGLASAWILTITLHFLASSGSDRVEMVRSSRIPAAAFEMARAERRLLMSTLVRTTSPEPVSPRRDPVHPVPRSERKAGWSNA